MQRFSICGGEELQALVIKTSGIVEPMREILVGAKGIEPALVFGSLATGAETADSDIDLMVVGTISPRKVSDLLNRCREKRNTAENDRVGRCSWIQPGRRARRAA